MVADVSDDVGGTKYDVVGRHVALIFSIFKGPMGLFLHVMWHHPQGDMW